MANIKSLIDKVNEGDFELVNNFFGSISDFLDFLNEKNLISELNLINNEEVYGEEINKIAKSILEHNPEHFWEYVLSSLDDVTYENGNYYVTLNDRGSLHNLFCDNRNSLSVSTISDLLDGDYTFDFYDTTDNIFRDVIEELEPDKLNYLANKINDELLDSKISPETDLLEEIANEQGHSDYVLLNTELIVNKIFNDEESTEYILSEANNVNSELYNIHRSAYETAYYDEVYEGIINELDTFFDMKASDWVEVKSPTNPNKSYQYFKVKINDFEYQIKKFIDSHLNYSDDTLSSFGDYINILNENINMGDDKCLIYFAPDYADWGKTRKLINDFFYDYI